MSDLWLWVYSNMNGSTDACIVGGPQIIDIYGMVVVATLWIGSPMDIPTLIVDRYLLNRFSVARLPYTSADNYT